MAKWACEVVTPWTGTGQEEDANRPDVADKYMAGAYWREGQKWEDRTAQAAEAIRPDPNLYVVYMELEADVLEALEKSNDYLILWSEEIAEGF